MNSGDIGLLLLALLLGLGMGYALGLRRSRSPLSIAQDPEAGRRLQAALEQNRLRLVRHDIVPLQGSSQGHHYEILIRLADAHGELTTDAHFLGPAEQMGLAPRIDAWVVTTTLDWLARHPEHVARLYLCSINLSGSSLGQPEFHDLLRRRLQNSRVPPDKICFEITETAAIADIDRAIEFIHGIKAMGCRFALDDFGSGLSSFAYLRNLPVDFVKIDGGFVRGMADDPEDFALVRSLNEIGKLLGKQTIAEFAENERVIQKLREVGVDYIQGHGVSQPVPIDAPVEGPATTGS